MPQFKGHQWSQIVDEYRYSLIFELLNANFCKVSNISLIISDYYYVLLIVFKILCYYVSITLQCTDCKLALYQ